ncbi:MAG: SIS domain-containing protein [Calditrichaeota bacterium]|nr:MAG: SIS domain-containing protein [Calditrichota bacterium]
MPFDIRKTIETQINEHLEVQQKVLDSLASPIEECAQKWIETLRQGCKLLFCGNGGSAADSQHLAAELVVRLRGSFERPAIPAMALTVDTSILTAGGNDYGFERVFARQVEALGKAGDLLVALSTSGNSSNVIAAVEQAHKQELYTVGFLGGDGGKLGKMVDLPLIVPSTNTARIQEAHILIGHILCLLLETELYSTSSE